MLGRFRRVVFCLMFLLASAGSWAGETWHLTILHTNDLHGYMMPFDYRASNLKFALTEGVNPDFAHANAGGLARRSTLISNLRKKIHNPLVLIDAGDLFTRGPWHKRFYGVPEVAAYNQIGYDIFCVGNNEFKGTSDVDSQQIMLGLMRQSRFPWLAANLTVGDTGVPVEGIHPYVIRRYGNVRVGFLGLTAPRSKDYPQTKGWTISDPIEAAKRWVPIAHKECDILIAVTHIGADTDKELAAKVDGIDAIVGGDSHTFIPSAIMVKNPKGILVPIVQDGAYGVRLGELDLCFEKTDVWRLKKASSKLISVDSKTKEDPAVKSLLEQWLKPALPAKVSLLPGLFRMPQGVGSYFL